MTTASRPLATLLLLVAALGAACGNDSKGGDQAQNLPAEPPPEVVLFTRDSSLYVAHDDGSQARKLASRAEQAAVSPDSRRVAIVRDESIWVMNRDGSEQRRLTSGEEDFGPAWSPDGKTVYFSRRISGKDEQGGYVYAFAIFRMGRDGRALRQLTHPELEDHGVCHLAPAPSPDGRLVAFADFYTDCDHGWANAISAIDEHGREASLEEFDLDSGGFDPAWSPDGSLLAFAATDDDYGEPVGIKLASSSGPPETQVYAGWSSDPAWSRDGARLAFVADGDIWLVGRDGTGLRNITKTPVEERDPVWLSE